MQRNKIKADGTIYAVKDGSTAWVTPVKVVETARLWDRNMNRRNDGSVSLARSGAKMDTATRSGSVWSSYWSYTGFLVVRAEKHSPEALEALRTFDLTHVREMPTDKANELYRWNDALPDGLTVDVAVSRQFVDEWDVHTEKETADAVARAAKRQKAERDRLDYCASETRAQDALRAYGVYTTYGGGTPPRANVTVDAETLANLLEKLSPQRVLDAVADYLRETFDFSPVDERIMQEIQGALPVIQAQINDELK